MDLQKYLEVLNLGVSDVVYAHMLHEKKMKEIEKAYSLLNKEHEFYTWKAKHPILRHVPIIVNQKRKKIFG